MCNLNVIDVMPMANVLGGPKGCVQYKFSVLYMHIAQDLGGGGGGGAKAPSAPPPIVSKPMNCLAALASKVRCRFIAVVDLCCHFITCSWKHCFTCTLLPVIGGGR